MSEIHTERKSENEIHIESVLPIEFDVVTRECSSVKQFSYKSCDIHLTTNKSNQPVATLVFKKPTKRLSFQLDGFRDIGGFKTSDQTFRMFTAANHIVYPENTQTNAFFHVFCTACEGLQNYHPISDISWTPPTTDDEEDGVDSDVFRQFQQVYMFGHFEELAEAPDSSKDLHQWIKQALVNRLTGFGFNHAALSAARMNCSHIFARASLLEEPSNVAGYNRICLEANANQVLSDAGDHIMVAIAGFDNSWQAFQHLNGTYVRSARCWKLAGTSNGSPREQLQHMYERGVRELQMIGVEVLSQGGIDPESPAVQQGRLQLRNSGEIRGLGRLLRKLHYKPYSGQPRSTVDHSHAASLIDELGLSHLGKGKKRRLEEFETLTLRNILMRHFAVASAMNYDELRVLSTEIINAARDTQVKLQFRCASITCSLTESVDAVFAFVISHLDERLGNNAPSDMKDIELWVYQQAGSRGFLRLDVSEATMKKRKFHKVKSKNRFQDIVDHFLDKTAKLFSEVISKYKLAVQKLWEQMQRPNGPKVEEKRIKALSGANRALRRLAKELTIVPLCQIEICVGGAFLDADDFEYTPYQQFEYNTDEDLQNWSVDHYEEEDDEDEEEDESDDSHSEEQEATSSNKRQRFVDLTDEYD